MTEREALKLALEALELNEKCSQSMDIQICADASQKTFHAITAIKEALAQPEQEPFGYFRYDLRLDAWVQNREGRPGTPFYTNPPQRKPLSNQKIIEMYNEPRSDAEMIEFARAIEAAHGIWPENSDCYGPDWTDRDGEYLK